MVLFVPMAADFRTVTDTQWNSVFSKKQKQNWNETKTNKPKKPRKWHQWLVDHLLLWSLVTCCCFREGSTVFYLLSVLASSLVLYPDLQRYPCHCLGHLTPLLLPHLWAIDTEFFHLLYFQTIAYDIGFSFQIFQGFDFDVQHHNLVTDHPFPSPKAQIFETQSLGSELAVSLARGFMTLL